MSAPLLSYALGWSTTPLLAGSTVSLSVTADNTSGRPVELSSVAIALPLGANADDVATSVSGSVPPAGWGATGSATVTFTPAGGRPVLVRGQSITFELTGIAVNAEPGMTKPIEVVETAAPRGGKPVVGTYGEPVDKFPAGFSLSDVTVTSPTPVPLHKDAKLMWTGTEATYTMQRSDRPDDLPAPVGSSGPWTAIDLSEAPLVSFTLTASVTVANQPDPLLYEKYCPVSVRQPRPKIKYLRAKPARGTAPSALYLEWDVANVAACAIPGLFPHSLLPESSDVFTPSDYRPLAARVALQASNLSGSVEDVQYVTWGAASATGTVPVGNLDAVYEPAGDRLYVSSGSRGSADSVSILDGKTLKPLSDPLPAVFGLLALSPDGSTLYIGAGHVVKAFDVTSLPATQVAESPPLPSLFGPLLVRGADIITFVGSAIQVMDAKTLQFGELAPLPRSTGVYSPALSPSADRLYIAAGSDLHVLDAGTFQPVQGSPFSAGMPDAAINAVMPDGSLVIGPSGMANSPRPELLMIDPEPPFAVRARRSDLLTYTMTPSVDGGCVFVWPQNGSITALSADTLEQVLPPLPQPASVWAGPVVTSADGGRLFALDQSTGAATLFRPTGISRGGT